MMVTVWFSEPAMGKTATILYSKDMHTWSDYGFEVKNNNLEQHITVPKLEAGKEYYFKGKIGGKESKIASGYTKPKTEMKGMISHEASDSNGDYSYSLENVGSSMEYDHDHQGEGPMCERDGKNYSFGETFYDGCDHYCACGTGGEIQCVPIECPTDGMDLLDPDCLKWEPDMEGFEKKPPTCCPDIKCVERSSCTIESGKEFRNFDEIPEEITGCDKRCYCEYGNITCHSVCPPMGTEPPRDLPCPAEIATAVPHRDNHCCFMWACPPGFVADNNNQSKFFWNFSYNLF